MSAQEQLMMETAEAHEVGSARLFSWVWVALLVLTFIEVFLAYERLRVNIMLVVLMGLSVIKSALIIAYFMHMKYEKRGLAFLLFPALVFCVCVAMAFSVQDSIRLLNLRPH